MVIHGEDGLDEISISDATKISRFKGGRVENFFIAPEDFGIERKKIDSILGGNKEENAMITLSILNGEKDPRRDIVLMNAGAALMVAGKSGDFRTAFAIAADAIDSGRALKKLEELKKVSNSL
jgi:anthranilate phosphoribosyltransferase